MPCRVADRRGGGRVWRRFRCWSHGDVQTPPRVAERPYSAAEATFFDADRLAHGYTGVRDAQKSFAEPGDAATPGAARRLLRSARSDAPPTTAPRCVARGQGHDNPHRRDGVGDEVATPEPSGSNGAEEMLYPADGRRA